MIGALYAAFSPAVGPDLDQVMSAVATEIRQPRQWLCLEVTRNPSTPERTIAAGDIAIGASAAEWSPKASSVPAPRRWNNNAMLVVMKMLMRSDTL
jgi:hypothetical protein